MWRADVQLKANGLLHAATMGMPIVAPSAVADRRTCIDGGCRAFLAKPSDLDAPRAVLGPLLPSSSAVPSHGSPPGARRAVKVLGAR
jgi:hypothetical protein